ncbi:protein Niban 1-like isoform X2 [Scomber scombrus]|uniref:protein Niban 1-like isoform X2 n=1 Tax=Scomber scombrus TaxID=13677 RepID=UPI002DDB4140|nr:protein Niban 1-like isoform X2 [Scomber scombrus]
MGASSSGLLDEAKISHIKGLVNNTFQKFSEFYRQQYSAAYLGHLHQELEPKKEGRGLLLTHRPKYAPEDVLYQGSIKSSGWDEQGKKCKERFIVLRRNYKVEIHENMETFNRGVAAKLVLQPAGGNVLTTEEESRALLERTCAGILIGVKEDSSSAVSSSNMFAVYLHLPYTGHTCFLFQQEEERDPFLSALKTCIRHCNLDPWCDSSYESQAYIRALQLYRQDLGCYQSWEILLGTEEQVLASQVMVEVLPWLQSQLQSRVKGKKAERMRQWLATVQATYMLVLEQLTASLETLKGECRQTASTKQALIRSDLDQIMTSHSFLEKKVRDCICKEAEKVCNDSVAPYMSSILEALTENISVGIQEMQHTLRTQMDTAFTNTNERTEETKKALSTLRSISLDPCYRQVANLTVKLQDLKQRFGLNSAQRLVHSAHLEMEQLLDSAVYTLELFLQSSTRLQPSQVPVKMDRAKGRVLKQLDYDSRVVQRRIYEEALLEITHPALTRGMHSKWKSEFEQFEQYIFSDYCSFILVHNVYDDVLRNILSKEIETVVQDAASKKTNNLLLDTTDLAISQYSLLGHTPPLSAPGSPAFQARDSSSGVPSGDKESAPLAEEGNKESAPLVEEGEKESAPLVEKGGKESAPVVDEVGKESAPLVEEGVKESAPVVDEGGKESAPLAEEGNKESAPLVEKGGKESAPVVDEVGKESAPLVEEGGKESAPVVDEGCKESAPVVDEGGKESAPLVEKGGKESAPLVEEGGKESAPLVEKGGKESAPLVEEGSESTPVVDEESAPQPKDGGTESAPVVEAAGQSVTAAVGPQSDPELKTDISTLLISDQSRVLLSPVIIVTQQFDEPQEEASCFEVTNKEVQLTADTPPAAESSDSALPDSDAAVIPESPTVPESSTPIPVYSDPPASPLSPPQLTEVPAVPVEGAQSEQSDTPENPAVPDLTASNQTTEDASSPQPSIPSLPQDPYTDSPMKISLGSLSQAVGRSSTATPVPQTAVRQNTDRAVYLTGVIKDIWEMERVKGDKQKEASEEEDNLTEDQKEESETREEKEEQVEKKRDEGQTGGERVDDCCRSSESPAESATAFTQTPEQSESEEKVDEKSSSEAGTEKKEEEEKVDREKSSSEAGTERKEEEKVDEEKSSSEAGTEKKEEEEKVDEEKSSKEAGTEKKEEEEKVDEEKSSSEAGTERKEEEEKVVEEKSSKEAVAEKKEKEEEEEQRYEKPEEDVLESSKPMELEEESDPELPLGSVSIIRDLVTEITEVETVIHPCPTSS